MSGELAQAVPSLQKTCLGIWKDANIDTSEAEIPGVAKPSELFTNLEAAKLIISISTTWLCDRVIDHAKAMLKDHVRALYATAV